MLSTENIMGDPMPRPKKEAPAALGMSGVEAKAQAEAVSVKPDEKPAKAKTQTEFDPTQPYGENIGPGAKGAYWQNGRNWLADGSPADE